MKSLKKYLSFCFIAPFALLSLPNMCVSRKIFTLLTSYDEEISVGMKGEHNEKANKTTESSTNSPARLQKLFFVLSITVTHLSHRFF
jgi:hypothetical protein